GPGRRYAREVWGWGWNEHGNLGIVRRRTPVLLYGCGRRMGRLANRAVGIWGGNGTSWILVKR
ncbi:uncharacterized protein B0H18DRAFT_1006391, partial [Fomitopsis serialis]|uniref:uncharacterized protein n=1 Tax=Fomitopsis serialis TaxID=139415 RepID=UPI002008622B